MTLTAIWTLLKRVPGWVWLALAGLAFGFAYVQSEKAKAVKLNNMKRDKEAAEVESEVISNIADNSNELLRESDAVRSLDAVRQLPDGTQSLPDYHYRD